MKYRIEKLCAFKRIIRMFIRFIRITADAELGLFDNQINIILVIFTADVDAFIVF